MTFVQKEKATPVKRSSNTATGKQYHKENESVALLNELGKNKIRNNKRTKNAQWRQRSQIQMQLPSLPTSAFRLACSRSLNHSKTMNLIGLVLSWSTINAAR
jgi:hypothetical protein